MAATSLPTGSLAAGPLPAGDPAADALRRAGLRRMRTVATGLLVVAAIVYLLTREQDGFLGFVNAGAEASMVGAIADWFAVTALFRHPLGLPIPHTALIPKRKDDLGRGLEEFVGENFLQEAIIRDRMAAASISERIGVWLVEPAHAQRVVDEVAEVAAIALSKVRDDHIESLVRDALTPRFREEPIAPLLGGLLSEALRDNLHHGLVDLAVEELHGWLVENPDTVAEVLGERAPWWAPPRLNEAVTSRVHLELVRWVDDIRADPQHRARLAMDSVLEQLAGDLLSDPETQARAEAAQGPDPRQPGGDPLGHLALGRAPPGPHRLARGPAGAVRQRLLTEVTAFAERLVSDPALQARLDGVAADAAVFVVERYGEEVTSVITNTIEKWDGKEAADRIELHVGRDLQFIRINGTVVGGLVGVLIHTVSVLLS